MGTLGTPEAAEQRIIWVRNTLELNRIAVSSSYVEEAGVPAGWQMLPEEVNASFDGAGDLLSPFRAAVEKAHAS